MGCPCRALGVFGGLDPGFGSPARATKPWVIWIKKYRVLQGRSSEVSWCCGSLPSACLFVLWVAPVGLLGYLGGLDPGFGRPCRATHPGLWTDRPAGACMAVRRPSVWRALLACRISLFANLPCTCLPLMELSPYRGDPFQSPGLRTLGSGRIAPLGLADPFVGSRCGGCGWHVGSRCSLVSRGPAWSLWS